MSPTLALGIIVALGLLGGIGLGIKALLERGALRARAGSDDATAAVAVAQAARELIDPLRQELATERADHAEEIERERVKVQAVHKQLDTVRSELNEARIAAHELRVTLRRAIEETGEAKQRLADANQRIVKLEQELRRYREYDALNEEPAEANLTEEADPA